MLPEVDLAGHASIDPLGPETLGPALESFVAQFHEHFSYLCIYIERHCGALVFVTAAFAFPVATASDGEKGERGKDGDQTVSVSSNAF